MPEKQAEYDPAAIRATAHSRVRPGVRAGRLWSSPGRARSSASHLVDAPDASPGRRPAVVTPHQTAAFRARRQHSVRRRPSPPRIRAWSCVSIGAWEERGGRFFGTPGRGDRTSARWRARRAEVGWRHVSVRRMRCGSPAASRQAASTWPFVLRLSISGDAV